MKLVKHILEKKGNEIWMISPDAVMFDALKLLAEKEVGALLVGDSNKLEGILSERDYARKVFLFGKSSKDTPVRDIMSTNVIYVKPEESMDNCMALMINKRVRHLPVMENDKLVGIISIGDVVNAIIDEKEFEISQLVHYIKGTH